MSTNNRQRRAAKARQRARRRSTAEEPSRPRIDHTRRAVRIYQLLTDAAVADQHGRRAALQTLAAIDAPTVDPTAEALIIDAVARCWQRGWQPSELVRQARRVNGRAGRLMAVAVAVEHAGHAAADVDPRWRAQIEALEVSNDISRHGWIDGFGRTELLHRRTLLESVLDVLRACATAGHLRPIVSPPGTAARSAPSRTPAGLDDAVLAKVRALLAKAESTSFEAEADAFTAKAQELMARHAIDAALLWASTDRDERPTSVRIPIDDPYADITSLLLQRVAEHSRCRAVRDDHHGLSTVIGFAADVAATEVLFTSLLLQSQVALRAAASNAGPGERVRSRSFRSAFLMAFTQRISERLAEITAAVEHAAVTETHGALLPVLTRRGDAVDDAVDEIFGALQTSVVRCSGDAAGWVQGQLAADLAKLNVADLAGTSDGESAA